MSGQSELKTRMAIFGGTFDPPHRAHVELLSRIQKQFGFAKILVVPSKFPPGKTPVADFETRLGWTQKVFSAPGFEVSPIEQMSAQTIFGWDIFSALQAIYPQCHFYWVLGEDQWNALSYWKRIDDYGSYLVWLVLPRSDDSPARRPAGLLSRRLLGSTCSYYWAPVEAMIDVSSTDIRESQDDDRINDWIPESIRADVKNYYKDVKRK